MAPLRVLVCGGGCAGPALAFWLVRAGHHVTIVERTPSLRAAGSQIDLRAQGIAVIERMGLLDAVRDKSVDEPGVSLVDQEGRPIATILTNKSGRGVQTATSEFEIMRGDLVRILHEATVRDVNYIFNKTVESFEDDGSGVHVRFSDAKCASFDLLIGADGQGSRIRRHLQGLDTPDPFRRLGVYMAYWQVPRIASDSDMRHSYIATGSRMIMRRSHNKQDSQALFSLRDSKEGTRAMPTTSVQNQKRFWSERFQNAGWQSARFLRDMQDAKDFYCQEIVQVDTNVWYKGRVALVGDAAHCPSPLTGMGTTSALVGAYVLAGEINDSNRNLTRAFENYDKTLRPFITEAQKINPTILRCCLPQSRLGVMMLQIFARFLCSLRIPELVAYFSKGEKGGWALPDYGDVVRD